MEEMGRKFIYDDKDKLIDFEDDDYEFIEKNLNNTIPSIYAKEKSSGRFIGYYIIPKTCKIEELREKVFGFSYKTLKEAKEKGSFFGVWADNNKSYNKVELIKSLT